MCFSCVVQLKSNAIQLILWFLTVAEESSPSLESLLQSLLCGFSFHRSPQKSSSNLKPKVRPFRLLFTNENQVKTQWWLRWEEFAGRVTICEKFQGSRGFSMFISRNSSELPDFASTFLSETAWRNSRTIPSSLFSDKLSSSAWFRQNLKTFFISFVATTFSLVLFLGLVKNSLSVSHLFSKNPLTITINYFFCLFYVDSSVPCDVKEPRMSFVDVKSLTATRSEQKLF